MAFDETAAAMLGLRALGGLLSLPRAMQASDQDAQMARQLLLSSGMSQEDVDRAAPDPGMSWLSPARGGVGGTILGGVGDLGNVINTIVGQPIRAPRYDMGEASQLWNAGQKAQERKASEAAAAQFKNPTAIALAKAGKFSEAQKAEEGGGTGVSGTLGVRIQKYLDAGYPLSEARVKALAEDDAVWRGRTAYSGGVTLGNQQTMEGVREGTRRTGEAHDLKTTIDMLNGLGFRITPPGAATEPSAVQPQSAPAGPDPTAVQPAVGGANVTEIPKTPPVAPGINTHVSGATVNLPSGTVQYSQGDKASSDLDLLAASRGYNLRALTPEQSQDLQRMQLGLTAARQKAKASIELANRPLPENDRAVFTAIMTSEELISRALSEFTPEERDQYVGILRQPFHEWKQLLVADPRFAEFQSLVAQIEAAKFDFGGKQLTGIEQQIVDRFTPTGREIGGRVQFDAKAQQYLNRMAFQKGLRLKLLGGRATVAETLGDEANTTTTPTTSTVPNTTTTTVPSSADAVEAAKARLRAQGIAIP